MLLSKHVHFLIITYIHISCIFSELVSQCASVRMTQFFYIESLLLLFNFELLLSRHLNCYCPHIELLLSNHYCLTLNCYYLDIWTVTVHTLNFFSFISTPDHIIYHLRVSKKYLYKSQFILFISIFLLNVKIKHSYRFYKLFEQYSSKHNPWQQFQSTINNKRIIFQTIHTVKL
jgi:hypothetical protein